MIRWRGYFHTIAQEDKISYGMEISGNEVCFAVPPPLNGKAALSLIAGVSGYPGVASSRRKSRRLFHLMFLEVVLPGPPYQTVLQFLGMTMSLSPISHRNMLALKLFSG